MPDAVPSFPCMDQVASARVAVGRAIDDVQTAIARVRSAQQVDWVSVLASRYREELYAVLQDLARLRGHLEEIA